MSGVSEAQLTRLLTGLREMRDGNFRRRLAASDDDLYGELAAVFNELADNNQRLVSELGRVAKSAKHGELPDESLDMAGAGGGWSVAAGSVNDLLTSLVEPTAELSRVLDSVAQGDFTQRMTHSAGSADPPGELSMIHATVNGLLDQLSLFSSEITRVSREIGSEGRLGGQAQVPGLTGTWRELADAVNRMAADLTGQVRDVSQVAQAVAAGDLSRKITVSVSGEMLELKDTINTMVDQLSAFASEVTRVARDVAGEGVLGGQANVPNVAGIWKDLTDNVNTMADNLTLQVRDIAQVTTAVANGDLSKKIDVAARGEMLELKDTINTMVDQLSAFASEVTRVAREVGTEGKLGGQAEVTGVSGTWQRLTESVNQLAGNLTTQVRAIATVATAVAAGDLSRQITVDASGEVADLKDNINEMINNLQQTTQANQEQDWLKSNLAKLSGMMQGHHDLNALASMIISELAPLASAQYGAFFLVRTHSDGTTSLERTASYGRPRSRKDSGPVRFVLGEGLVGQAAMDKRTIRMKGGLADYVRISSGLGTAAPVDLVVLPVLFEGEVLGIVELASVNEFTSVHFDLLEQLKETIGVNVNTIVANSRTEMLLSESQHLAQELRARSEQLEQQQNELQRSNIELEEKAALLASRNRDIEIKNIEIEQARQELEERAGQLSLASTYKSEFLANMSHELRTPLNSALLLAKLLADNREGNLTEQQVDLARTIHSSGIDLLQMINDVLDLSKVESGYMSILNEEVEIVEIAERMDTLYQPLAAEKGLRFSVEVSSPIPSTLDTDKNRLEQILRNLLSNAVKFTNEGSVELTIASGGQNSEEIAFIVRDTGIGIPEEKLTLVFEAFQQADGTTARNYGGTGLGLSISRELSLLLGGGLSVDSTDGRGSTFTLTLPIGATDEEALEATTPADVRSPDDNTAPPSPSPDQNGVSEEPENQQLEQPASGEQLPGMSDGAHFDGQKILVVDDDPRGVLALGTLLEQRGLRVVYADNGISGLRSLQEQRDVEVVLVDVMMPELDGNATIKTIRAMPRYSEVPIIAVTAKAMQSDRDESFAAGASHYVTKPVDAPELIGLLSQYLRPAAGDGENRQ